MYVSRVLVRDIDLIMQIRELRMPPNSRRVTYEISAEGGVVVVKSEGEKR